MTPNFTKQLKGHIQNHDLETILAGYGKAAWKRGYYNRREFIRICLWKTGQQKQSYLSLAERDIIRVTGEAFKISDERDRIEKLCELKGVGIPVASALLTFYDPENYAIIDRPCTEVLEEQGVIEWRRISSDTWVDYLTRIRNLSVKLKTTPSRVVQGLYAFHRESQMQREFPDL